jgi:hypothetical protein
MAMTVHEARAKAREVMYDDQLEAVESLIRAIVANPDDPGLPLVSPPEETDDPQTGVHAVSDDPGAHDTDAPNPALLETIMPDAPDEEVPSQPAMTDYERGWRAGRGAAVRALEDLKSKTIFRTSEEAVLTDALHCVTSLEVKVDP